jgi:predicted DNA-binding protein (MmcQ/YjbR family)
VRPETLEAAALALPGASCSIQWGDHRVYKVGGKIFAVLGGGGERLSLKVTEIAFEVLTETGQARPAPYMARAGWVQFQDLDALDEAEARDWVATSHALVAAKLPKAARKELGLA